MLMLFIPVHDKLSWPCAGMQMAAPTAVPALPPGWEQAVDPASGKARVVPEKNFCLRLKLGVSNNPLQVYYANRSTGETSWTPPAPAAQMAAPMLVATAPAGTAPTAALATAPAAALTNAPATAQTTAPATATAPAAEPATAQATGPAAEDGQAADGATAPADGAAQAQPAAEARSLADGKGIRA